MASENADTNMLTVKAYLLGRDGKGRAREIRWFYAPRCYDGLRGKVIDYFPSLKDHFFKMF